MAGATFNAGMTVNLGAGNLFTNAGTLSPGGAGTVGTTNITGNFTQTGLGRLLTTLDSTAQTADRTNVTGTGLVGGTVQLQVINPALGLQQQTIFSAAGGTANNGVGLLTSPALQASLAFPNATDIILQTSLDFSPGGVALNPNQISIGDNLNAIVGAGNGGMLPIILALLNGVSNVADYQNALNQLSPEHFLHNEFDILFSALSFGESLQSCHTGEEGTVVTGEGSCMFARFSGRTFDRDQDVNFLGFQNEAINFTGGSQLSVGGNWRIGTALGYEHSSIDTTTLARSRTDRLNLGGVLKYDGGPLQASASVSGGWSWIDAVRHVNFGGLNLRPVADMEAQHISGDLNFSYTAGLSASLYVKPQVNLNVTHIEFDGFTETGGGLANLAVAGFEETYFSVSPAIELGAHYLTENGNLFRPFVKLGLTIFEDTDANLQARFANAPAGVPSFAIASSFGEEVLFDVEAGFEIVNNTIGNIKVIYDGQFSEDVASHAGSVKVTIPFQKFAGNAE